MPQQVSIAEARDNLSKLVRSAEQGEPIEFTRRGHAVAVLIAARDYRRLTEQQRSGFMSAVRELRARYELGSTDLDQPDIDPAELFPRDQSPGRDVSFPD